MVSYQDIKRNYIRLYRQLRKYIWTYDTVECLAYFENELLKRFPDLKKCRSLANNLYNMCSEVIKEDEDLKNQFTKFKKLLEESDDTFSYLNMNISKELM